MRLAILRILSFGALRAPVLQIGLPGRGAGAQGRPAPSAARGGGARATAKPAQCPAGSRVDLRA